MSSALEPGTDFGTEIIELSFVQTRVYGPALCAVQGFFYADTRDTDFLCPDRERNIGFGKIAAVANRNQVIPRVGRAFTGARNDMVHFAIGIRDR